MGTTSSAPVHVPHTTLKPTQKPTSRPTKLVPMNLCEAKTDEATCAAEEDCVFDKASGGCFAISDGDCGRLPDATICRQNEDCHWSATEKKCKGECDGYHSSRTCANGEDCLWSTATAECLSIFAQCDR